MKFDIDDTTCFFCGRSIDEDSVSFVAGAKGALICNVCIERAYAMLNSIDKEKEEKEEIDDIPTPKEIKSKLDEFIVGQDMAKKILSEAVYNHYKHCLPKRLPIFCRCLLPSPTPQRLPKRDTWAKMWKTYCSNLYKPPTGTLREPK